VVEGVPGPWVDVRHRTSRTYDEVHARHGS
jgi:hypothetical protein